jgi:DNA-binding CsgD family transcriptional regulator
MNTKELEAKIDQMYLMIGRIEGTVEGLKDRIRAIEQAPQPVGEGAIKGDADAIMAGFTPKQHAVLQMLINGKSTTEIAERLHVTESTAKVHIRLMAKKCNVKLRRQIVVMLSPAFRKMSANRYLLLSGGLPKNWDAEWGKGSEEYDYMVVHDEPGERQDASDQGAGE